jgi:hypothetical protein
MQQFLTRYYIKSSLGYYNFERKMFFEEPSIPENSSFHTNDFSYIREKSRGLSARYPDNVIIKVEIPVKVSIVK